MKILLMVTALTLASAGSVSNRTTNLPHPWLTLDRSAKVLSLQCKPPEEASLNWREVHDLRLTAFLPQHSTSNISLVTVTSNMKEPKVNDLFTIHGVTFQGSWPTVSVSLDFLFPITDKEVGRYFCTVHHSDKDDKLSTFTTEIVVNQDLVSSHIHIQPKNVNGFVMEVIEAHEVNVTWRSPKSQTFAEASVSRMLADEEGTPMAPSMSLFSTNGVRQLVYNSDVLLAKFNPQDSGNLSITLYVKRYAHSRSYRYTCRVPYPACTGHGAVHCMCCQDVANPDTQVCPTPPVCPTSPVCSTPPVCPTSPVCSTPPVCQVCRDDSQTYLALFSVFLILFLVLFVFVLFKRINAYCQKTSPKPKELPLNTKNITRRPTQDESEQQFESILANEEGTPERPGARPERQDEGEAPPTESTQAGKLRTLICTAVQPEHQDDGEGDSLNLHNQK